VTPALRGRFPGAVLLGLGFAALYEGSGLSFGSLRQPGSGFYPTLVCVALIAFSAMAFAKPSRTDASEAGEPHGHARAWLVVAAVALYAWALTSVGFVMCTAALLIVLLRGIGAVSWPLSLAAAAAGSIATYVLFSQLGMPLPAGMHGL
jgi:putative tricarboxylic transport membrane protein